MRLLLFVILIGAHCVKGQDSLKLVEIIPRHAVKFSPFHLVNFYPTIQLAYEHAIKGRFTAQLDLGYVLDYNDTGEEEFQNKRGLKVKLEPRMYFGEAFAKPLMYYSSFELYYNRINFDRAGSQEECFDLSCEHIFRRWVFYEVKYREHGGTAKFGLVRYYNKLLFDLNVGWTLRFIEYDHGLPGREPISQWFDVPNENDRTSVSPHIGIRFGYRFK